MANEVIMASDIYEPAGIAHAVKSGNVVYTTGIVGYDKNGRLVGKGDLAAQTEQTFENLDSVLRAAGATWNDVVKVFTYTPRAVAGYAPTGGWEGRSRHREIRDRYLPMFQKTGLGVHMDLMNPDVLVEVDLVAHIDAPKHVITNVPNVYMTPRVAHAIRVDDTLYASGQQPVEVAGQVGRIDITESPVAARGDFEAQARFVFDNHDAILKAAGLSWDNVVKLHQYLTGPGVGEMLGVRRRYLPGQMAASTTVTCGLAHQDWMIEVDLEAYYGNRQSFMANKAPVTRGTAHATRVGDTIYIQGMVARSPEGDNIGRGDIAAQTEAVFQSLGNILDVAGAGWDDVVQVKSYVKNREDFPGIRRVRSNYIKDGTYAATAVLAGFFDPDYLLEVEAIAVVE